MRPCASSGPSRSTIQHERLGELKLETLNYSEIGMLLWSPNEADRSKQLLEHGESVKGTVGDGWQCRSAPASSILESRATAGSTVSPSISKADLLRGATGLCIQRARILLVMTDRSADAVLVVLRGFILLARQTP